MSKTKQNLNTCPHCGGHNLHVKQDAIRTYEINKKGAVKYESEDVSGLDNSWLECADCMKDSNESEKLQRIFDLIDWG